MEYPNLLIKTILQRTISDFDYAVNEFTKTDVIIVATQTHVNDGYFVAVIYYRKTLPKLDETKGTNKIERQKQ